ncbi:MAG: cobalamin B12-binding domain-containing protein [Desulfobacterales bacterium]|nr:cobalamin B12-binding domain-containing protein [Desulfobacterales bacterium]
MEAAKKEKIRVLFTRNLFEGHDIGLRGIVHKCRESGIEVVYYPRFKDFNEVVKVAEEEDVDIVGISSSSGAHVYLAEGLISSLRERGMDIPLIMGGVISDKDILRLKEFGVKGIFGPGSTPDEVVSFIFTLLDKH